MEKGNNQNKSSNSDENTTNKKEGQPKLNPQFTKPFSNTSTTPKEQKKSVATTSNSTSSNNKSTQPSNSNDAVEQAIRKTLAKPKTTKAAPKTVQKAVAPKANPTSKPKAVGTDALKTVKSTPQPTPKVKKTVAPAIAPKANAEKKVNNPKSIQKAVSAKAVAPNTESSTVTPVQKTAETKTTPPPITQEKKEQIIAANRIVESAQGRLDSATNKTVEAQKAAQNKMESLASKGELAVQALKNKTTQINTKSTPDTNLLDKAPKTSFPKKLVDLVDTPKSSENTTTTTTSTTLSTSEAAPEKKATSVNKATSIEQTHSNQSQSKAPKKVEETVPNKKPLTAFKDSSTLKTAAPKKEATVQKEEKVAAKAAITPTVALPKAEPVIKKPINTTPKQPEVTQKEIQTAAIAPNEQEGVQVEMKTTEKLPPLEALGQSLISLFSKPEKGEQKESTYWTAPISQKKTNENKTRFSLKEFFLFSSGVDRDILQHCPADESRFLGVGGTVIFTGVLAFLSSTYAIFTVFDNWLMAVFFGMIWGFMIYNLDRYIVGSMKNHGSWWKDMTIAFPRLLMAVLLALVISKPLELKIFEKEINAELITMEQEVYQEQENKVKQRYQDQITKYEASVMEMTTELEGLRAKRDTLEIMALREADGSGGSGNKNMGPIYKAKRKDADNARAEFDQEKARLMPLIVANQEKADELKADMEEEVGNLDQQAYGGMAARMEALHRLGEESEAIWWASMMIMLLFVIVEVSPVLVKLISSKSAYDYLSLHKEHAIKMATQEEIAEANKQLQNRVQFETETNVYRTQMLIQLEKEMIDEFVERQRAEMQGRTPQQQTQRRAKAKAS